VDAQGINQKNRRSGRVIRLFTVEIVDASSAPEAFANLNNSYAQLSDEERMKDINETFGLLFAEACRESGENIFEQKKSLR
jgi:hypothetical protein